MTDNKIHDCMLAPELTGVDAEDLTHQANAAAVAFYGPDVPVHISWAGAATMTRTGAAYKFTAMAIIHPIIDQSARVSDIHAAAQKAGIPTALIDALFGKETDDARRSGWPGSPHTQHDHDADGYPPTGR